MPIKRNVKNNFFILMNSEPNLKWTDFNSIPKILNDYINCRKKIKNYEDLFIRNDYIFSREDFLIDDYFLCEIILLLTALSKKAEIYMMKICDMNSDIQEFWADSISKYIEMSSIMDDEKSKNNDSQSIAGSLYQQATPMEIFKHLSKDKFSKMSSNKMFDSVTFNDNNSKYQYNISSIQNNREILNNNDLSKSHNLLIDFEEQKNLILNMDKIKNKNNELLKEKKNLLEIIERNEKTSKALISTLKEENKNLKKELQEIKLNSNNDKKKYEQILKEKENEKILSYEKKMNEYENEISKLNNVIKDNENKFNKENKILETKLKLSENTLITYEKYKEENNKIKEDIIKLENENNILKTYKEYKNKYEELILRKEENNHHISNYDIENITQTKEKLLSALKNNVNIQKDNEKLRKEIISLKEELKNSKKEIEKLECEQKRKKEGYVDLYENLEEKEKKEIDYKNEYEKMVLKAERYKYLLDNRDKQIEQLQKLIEKEKNENKKNKIYFSNNNIDDGNKNKKEFDEIGIDIENNNKSSKAQYKKINNYKKKNSNEPKINLNKEKDISLKTYKNKTNDNINISQNLIKENITTIKSEKVNYINININNNKSKKNNSKSFKRKGKILTNKKLKERFNNNNNNSITNSTNNSNHIHSLAQSNITSNNQILNNFNLSDTDKLFVNENSILNLGSSVKINTNRNNIINIPEKIKDKKLTINKKGEIRSTSNNNYNNINKNDNSIKNINNINENNIKYLLDKIYIIIKKDKKSHNEFISFVKKINKELNLKILNSSNKKNNININEEIINEKNQEIKELKNQLNLNKRKESDIKLKLTFLQSEKIKLEGEKIKLTEEIKKFQKGPNISNFEQESSKKLKKMAGIIHSDKNILIMNDIGRLTTNINISPKKELESFEGIKNSDNNLISGEKSTKYTFRKKKLLNKSPSLEAGNALSFKKLFSNEDKNSNYEDESNDININNDENNLFVNKIKELENDNIILSNKIKDLNEELKTIKLKGDNFEMVNNNLIKENIGLKQSLILIKENYEKEFTLVSNSLINLTEKYQQIKRELKQKNKNIE